MNKAFETYVRSSAFRVDLSYAQIIHLDRQMRIAAATEKLYLPYNMATLRAMERKGILSFEDGKGFAVTEEGKLLHQLLTVAGYYSEDEKGEEDGN